MCGCKKSKQQVQTPVPVVGKDNTPLPQNNMETSNTKIKEVSKNDEFGTYAVKCCEDANLDDLQTLLSNRGVNTFVIFLRGLTLSDEQIKAMTGKSITIVWHDFAVSELTTDGNVLTWVSDDGESRSITKVRAASANTAVSDEELRQIALNSLNARLAAGAKVS